MTTYPQEIQTFPTMQDINETDAQLVEQYQQAMESGNIELAEQILSQIEDADKKILTANYFNTISDTVYELQKKFNLRYSPAYIVSETQPTEGTQEEGDFWFKVV